MAVAATPAQISGTAASSFGPTEIMRELSAVIEPARALIRPVDRIAFASDASLYRLISRAVVQPITLGEVRSLFEFNCQKRIPLTFRESGAGLSRQVITDGRLVNVGRYWRSAKVEEDGRLLRVQPRLIGHQANHLLKQYGTKIGPDPASLGSARLGGILSINAGAMCCGVPLSSNGFEAAHNSAVNRTIERSFRWPNGGDLPIIVDTSPCTYGLKTARAHLCLIRQTLIGAQASHRLRKTVEELLWKLRFTQTSGIFLSNLSPT